MLQVWVAQECDYCGRWERLIKNKMNTEYVPFLLVTANVGSVFEDVSALHFSLFLSCFVAVVAGVALPVIRFLLLLLCVWLNWAFHVDIYYWVIVICFCCCGCGCCWWCCFGDLLGVWCSLMCTKIYRSQKTVIICLWEFWYMLCVLRDNEQWKSEHRAAAATTTTTVQTNKKIE